MTFKRLRNYRLICAEIAQKEKTLAKDKWHVVDTVQSAAEFPYWLHEVPIEGDVYPYDPQPYFGLILRLKSEKNEIERFVAGIDDYIVQRALLVRYIEPCDESVTWEDTAVKIGYPGSGNALKQRVWQHLSKR